MLRKRTVIPYLIIYKLLIINILNFWYIIDVCTAELIYTFNNLASIH